MDIECATCGRIVHATDGRELEEGDCCWECLDAEVERLRAALKPFAERYSASANAWDVDGTPLWMVGEEPMKAAAAAMEE